MNIINDEYKYIKYKMKYLSQIKLLDGGCLKKS